MIVLLTGDDINTSPFFSSIILSLTILFNDIIIVVLIEFGSNIIEFDLRPRCGEHRNLLKYRIESTESRDHCDPSEVTEMFDVPRMQI